MVHVTEITVKDAAGTDRDVATLDALIAIVGEVQASPTANTVLDRLKTLATTLSSVSGYVDGMEALATALNGYVDGLETLIGSTNTAIATLDGRVDGLEALITSLNGYVDQLETKLDTLATAIATIGTRSYTDASGQHLAFTGTSAQSSAITATEVTISASKDCYVAFGSNPTASAGAGSMFLAAGALWTRRITSGWKIAAIQSSEAGALSIMPAA